MKHEDDDERESEINGSTNRKSHILFKKNIYYLYILVLQEEYI